MKTLGVDGPLLAALAKLTSICTFVDSEGNRLGHFRPTADRTPTEGGKYPTVVLDPPAAHQLVPLSTMYEFFDASGASLGYFMRLLDTPDYEGPEPRISEEELDEFAKEPGGRTLAEIMADLEQWK